MAYVNYQQMMNGNQTTQSGNAAMGGASQLVNDANGLMSMYNANSGSAMNAANNQAGIGIAQGNTLAGSTAGNQAFANQALQTGFDPNKALYAQTLQDVTDQTRAGMAARGIDMTPYGAGVEGNTLARFNNDWVDRSVQRQATAASTASGLENANTAAVTAGGGLASSSAMMPTQALASLMQAGAAPGAELSAGVNAFLSYLQTQLQDKQATQKNKSALQSYSDYESQFNTQGGNAIYSMGNH